MALFAFEFRVLKPLPEDKHTVLMSSILGLERDWVPVHVSRAQNFGKGL